MTKKLYVATCFAVLFAVYPGIVHGEKNWREEAYEEFEKTNKELEAAYRKARQVHVREYTEDSSLVKNFTVAHKAWLKWRDAEAEVKAYEQSGGGHTHGATVYEVMAGMNKARTRFLLGQQPEQNLSEEEQECEPTEGAPEYASYVGDRLMDEPFTLYRGHFGLSEAGGVFAIQWLGNEKVRGFFYPEGKPSEYRFYGVNEKQGMISVHVYKGEELVAWGDLHKSKVKGKLQWAGKLSGDGQTYSTSMIKLDNTYPRDNPKKTSYKVLAGFPAKSITIAFHANDRVSGGYLTPDGDEANLSGINYRKGRMYLQESGFYGDNEAIVGAHIMLEKRIVKGAIVWQGFKYLFNGDAIPVSIGRRR